MIFFRALIFLLLSSPLLAVEPGLYFDPNEPGFGVSLNRGSAGYAAVIYTYTPDGDQAWFYSDTGEIGEALALYAPSGLFPARLHELGEPVGQIILLDNRGALSVQYQIELFEAGCTGRPGPGPRPPFCVGEWRLERLAE